MSIAVLTQVYDEVRRLAIAGSSLAPGDFRLKKLIPPLEQAGKKTPVFAKLAQAAQKLVDSSEKESPQALLDLSTLITAILYTQGETGAKGKLAALETVDLGPPVTGTGARVLKPLIEALTSTGSGRLEIVRDAVQRGAFRDIRLVNPALRAIDDPYGEIGDLVADKVLPLYGQTIYPELKAGFDVKGRGGHVRRLRVMNRLDPDGTRELVEEALESGSKEMKIEALVCLRDSKDGLPHLLEQATAKVKDVRRAALTGMARFKDDEVVEVLKQALSGKDLEIATGPAAENPNPKLLAYLIEDGQGQLDKVLKTKSKTERNKLLNRFCGFLDSFAGRKDKQSVAFLSNCFDEHREELLALKGSTHTGGDDVVFKIARLLVLTESKPVLKKLGASHQGLPGEILNCCFTAAALTNPPKKVYDEYSLYLLAQVEKKRSGAAADRRQAMVDALSETALANRFAGEGGEHLEEDYFEYGVGPRLRNLSREVKLDPRWLDAAVEADELELVEELIRPKHKGVNQYLSRKLKELLQKRDQYWEVTRVLQAMMKAEHPELIKSYIEVLKKYLGSKGRTYYYTYWLGRLIPDLPKQAAQPLEELLPSLPDKVVDDLAPYVAELKLKQ